MDSPWSILTGANKDNDALVQELQMNGRIQSPRVAEAMRQVLFSPRVIHPCPLGATFLHASLHQCIVPTFINLVQVDRKHFIRPDMPARQAYTDEALPIGFSQTISAPHMHAAALELLQDHLRPGASVLDVGSGEHPCPQHASICCGTGYAGAQLTNTKPASTCI